MAVERTDTFKERVRQRRFEARRKKTEEKERAAREQAAREASVLQGQTGANNGSSDVGVKLRAFTRSMTNHLNKKKNQAAATNGSVPLGTLDGNGSGAKGEWQV